MTTPDRFFPTLARDPRDAAPFAVTPRHLAGPGDPRHITHYLSAAGWRDHSVPRYPHVLLEAPDRRTRLTLEPGAENPITSNPVAWQLHGTVQHWYAAFSSLTPVEIIAGFTDTLTGPPPAAAPGVSDVLAERGWSEHYRGIESMASDEEDVLLSREDDESWLIEAGTPHPAGGIHKVMWEARLVGQVPAHALAGLAATLSAPQPLLRHQTNIIHPKAVIRNTEVQGEDLQRRHERRLASARTAARTARRPAPPALKAAAPPGRTR
ncbi:DUF317 domain-containing protein [Streptomyces sp. NPDC050085]|uniref:DUF317 domain-containing protein n=1 Tax=Streptomyces sp. NPDC050085 TaxID=3365600 RepID=UPI00379071DD